MNHLFLRNLRCFAEAGWLPLPPLTLLIGENSTGKSTFLAATRLAWDLAHGRSELDLNEDPFQLGAFDQLAHVFGGARGRAKQIELGHRTGTSEETLEYRTTLVQNGAQALLGQQTLSLGAFELTATLEDAKINLSVRSGSETIYARTAQELPFARAGSPLDWDYVVWFIRRQMDMRASKSKHLEEFERLYERIRRTRGHADPRPYAFAPVRTKPLRTYDPIKLAPHPEGEHIPMLLARTFFADKRGWEGLRKKLEDFGRASGLFTHIDVRALGKAESEPFQLRVKVAGPLVNLVDVGYGVSQILPLLVESLAHDRGQTLLMQQPEVHLHPRAQAELGSLLGTLARHSRKRFVVETHSDYLIDRIRADVRDKKTVAPSQVAVLYFERKKGAVVVHHLRLDEMGNFLEVPPGYRAFFLAEERRFLGV